MKTSDQKKLRDRFHGVNLTIIKETSSDYINRISHEYALYVLENRAIPFLTDGLKLSQRIALYLMMKTTGEMKTVKLAGDMTGSDLYQHGNDPAEEVIKLLAAPFCNNYPLLDKRGGFGTRLRPNVFSDGRYTYVKQSQFLKDNIYIDVDILPQRDNYDGSKQMPLTFAPLIPVALLNGIVGIAVGFATTILPRKYDDLKKAVIEVLETGKVKNKLLPHYVPYDVTVIPVKGTPNKYVLAGKFERVNATTIRITELPPGQSLPKFREYLNNLIDPPEPEAGKKRSITDKYRDLILDYVDHSRDKINVEVICTKEFLANTTDEELVDILKIREYVTENLTLIDHRDWALKEYSTPQDIVKEFVEWRLGMYLVRYEYLYRREQEKVLYWACFIACMTGLKGKRSGTAIPDTLNDYVDRAAVKSAIVKIIQSHNLQVVDEVVDRLAQVPLYKWTKEGLIEAESKLLEAKAAETEYEKIIKTPAMRKAVFLKEVKDL